MAARREHAVVLVHLGTPAARGQVLDDTHREHDVERAVRPRQPPGLVRGEMDDLAHFREAHLVHLRPDDRDEGCVGVEGVDARYGRLLDEILRDVAERATDLED